VKEFFQQTQEVVESGIPHKRVYVWTKDVVATVGDVVERKIVAEMSGILVEKLQR
jgi:hypothetical protein